MRHKPVGKLSRALGIPITPKAAKVMDERQTRPGQHGRSRHVPSEYGLRLREKQRLREQYFISEAHLRRAFAAAARRPGPTGENLFADLERRLDAVVVRAGFARSVYQARQLVSHGHIEVNEHRLDRPGARLDDGDVVTVREPSRSMPVFVAAREAPDPPAVPAYLEVRHDLLAVRVVRAARRHEVPVTCDEQLVIEFYAR